MVKVKVETVLIRKGRLPHYKIPLQDMALGRHKHIGRSILDILEEVEITEMDV